MIKFLLVFLIAIFNYGFAQEWIPPDYVEYEQPQCQQKLCSGEYIDIYDSLKINLLNDRLDFAADQIQANGKQMTFQGNVEFVIGGILLTADYAEFTTTPMQLQMQGHVTLRRDNVYIVSDSIVVDGTNTFVMTNANFLSHKNHARASGDTITFKPNIGKKGHIHIANATYTTCLPNDVDWSFHTSNMLLNLNINYAFMNHATIKMHDVPVSYLPWGFLSLQSGRQWGILTPSFSNSNQSGFKQLYPMYMPLGPSVDFTISPFKTALRNDGYELQVRALTPYSHTELNRSYLRRDTKFIAEQQLKNNTVNGERWLNHLHQKLQFQFDRDLALKANINYYDLSDSYYLNDNPIESLKVVDNAGLTFIENVTNLTLDSTIGSLTIGSQSYNAINGTNIKYTNLKSFVDWHGSRQVNNSTFLDYHLNVANVVTIDNKQYQRQYRLLQFSNTHIKQNWTLDSQFELHSVNTDLQGQTVVPSAAFNLKFNNYSASNVANKLQLFASHNAIEQATEPRLLYESAQVSPNYYQFFSNQVVAGFDSVPDFSKIVVGSEWYSLNANSRNWWLAVAAQQYINQSNLLKSFAVEQSQQQKLQWVGEAQMQFSKNASIDTVVFHNSSNNKSSWHLHFLNHYHQNDVRQSIIEVSYHDYFQSGHNQQLNLAMYHKVNRKFGVLFNLQQSLLDDRNISRIVGLRYESCCFQIDIVAFNNEQKIATIDTPLANDSGILLQFSLKGVAEFGSGIRRQVNQIFSAFDLDVDNNF